MRNSVFILLLSILFISPCSCSLKIVGLNDSNVFHLKGNTSYRVDKTIDLQGRKLVVPDRCELKFDGGEIINGEVYFQSAIIKGHPKFLNCTYSGEILISKIDDRDFTSNEDTKTIQFLLKNAIENGVRCDLFRDYRINMRSVGASGLLACSNIDSGAEIIFHQCTIYNTTAFEANMTKPVIVLQDVKNVTIRDGFFHDVDVHNSHNFTKSAGCTFIQCFGDCEGINLINCKQENGDCILRSGVWTHDMKHPEKTPCVGLSNSTLKVQSLNVGYGLALYCGDNLNIEVMTNSPHRGLYCAGVSNSTIRYIGYNPLESKCHILIKDAVFRGGTLLAKNR